MDELSPVRVLVEDADGASSWATERVLARSGYHVETCPGPHGLGDGCPLVNEGRCDKLEGADVVLYALGIEGHQVLAATRHLVPELPIVIEALPRELTSLGHLADGAHTVSRLATGRAMTSAIGAAVSAR